MHAMTREQLKTVAPSIFTNSAYHKLSQRYRIAPTSEIVDLLESVGLYPVRAQQSRCRLPDKRDYVKHLVRFRRAQDMDGQVAEMVPEVVLINSFDGSTAYKLSLGIYRIICSNGLVCPTGDLGSISVRHSGGDDYQKRIIDASFQVIEQAPKALETATAWKQLALPAPVQHAYAEAAKELIDSPHVTAEQLLKPRRREDATQADGSRSLWTVFNSVEENALKGGITNKTTSGRRSTTRPITSVTRDVALNRALWVLAEELSKAMG